MGRLIDADRLKEVFDRNVVSAGVWNDIIDNQPTAYDVDKVVERLDDLSKNFGEHCEVYMDGNCNHK
jgi:hypothetical protein